MIERSLLQARFNKIIVESEEVGKIKDEIEGEFRKEYENHVGSSDVKSIDEIKQALKDTLSYGAKGMMI